MYKDAFKEVLKDAVLLVRCVFNKPKIDLHPNSAIQDIGVFEQK